MNYKHGGASVGRVTATYKTWQAMLRRARGKGSHPQYYVEVSVCARWNDFANFLADMGERPVGMTLDRHPDNKGNYEPGNCRWATKIEQMRNRRNNVYLTLGTETKCVAEWSRDLGIPVGRIWARINNNLTTEEVLSIEMLNTKERLSGKLKAAWATKRT